MQVIFLAFYLVHIISHYDLNPMHKLHLAGRLQMQNSVHFKILNQTLISNKYEILPGPYKFFVGFKLTQTLLNPKLKSILNLSKQQKRFQHLFFKFQGFLKHRPKQDEIMNFGLILLKNQVLTNDYYFGQMQILLNNEIVFFQLILMYACDLKLSVKL